MRDYSKVFKEFWIGETGRYIRSCGHEVRTLATYLISCPHANVLGLYYLPLPLLCHEAGLTQEGALKGLQSLSEVGFARYDAPSETVWVVNMARYQFGETLNPKDNNVKWLPTALASLPKSPFVQGFYEHYREAYHLPPFTGVGSPLEAPSEPLESSFEAPPKHVYVYVDRDIDRDSDGGVDGRAGASSGACEETTPRRPHRIPEGWQPGEEAKQWARSKGYERLIDLDVETAEFCQFWQSVKNDKDASKLNWILAWQRRMTEQYKFVENQINRPGPQRRRSAKGLNPEELAAIEASQRLKEEEQHAQQRRASLRTRDGDSRGLSAGA